MKRQILILFLLLQTSIDCNEAKEIACERFSNISWERSVGIVKTCSMREETSIDESNVTISTADESVKALDFYGNNKIFYLPINVAESFPNLLGYAANDCSIKEISKENFVGLSKLKVLYLSYNEIEKIPADSYEGLNNLEHINLDYNKIKFMNAKAFQGLNKLKRVRLRSNVCIDEDFNSQPEIARLKQSLGEKCKFHEPKLVKLNVSRIEKKLENELSSLKTQLEAAKADESKAIKECKTSLQKFYASLKTCERSLGDKTSELTTQSHEISQLKAQTNSTQKETEICLMEKAELRSDLTVVRSDLTKLQSEASSDKQKCQQQFDFLQNLQVKLESQWNQTCMAETKELRDNFEFKLQENGELQDNLMKVRAEIIKKNEEIKMLQKKNELLENQFSQ